MTDWTTFQPIGDGLSEPCVAPAATHAVGLAPDRAHVVVEGIVHAIDRVTWVGGPVLEVCLADGRDTLTLVFFGRRMAGLQRGHRLVARGTVGHHRGRRVILNPMTWACGEEAGSGAGMSGMDGPPPGTSPVP